MKTSNFLINVFILFVGTTIIISCEKPIIPHPEEPPCVNEFMIPDTITLGYGQNAFHCDRELSIKVDSIFADNRCPANAMCIWQGEVKVALTLSERGERAEFVLVLTDALVTSPNVAPFKHVALNEHIYRVALLEVLPYPESSWENENNNKKKKTTISIGELQIACCDTIN